MVLKNKVCIIGFNYSYKVLYKSFQISDKFNIVGISGKSKRDIGSNLPFKYFTSWKKMILQLNPDIVAIGVPPIEQEKVLLFLLKKKINFICEKPITNNAKKLNLFLKLNKKNNKVIKLIDLNFVTIPVMQKFKSLVNNTKIDNNTKIKIDWNFKPNSLSKISSWKNKKNKLGDEINNFFFHLISVIDFIFENADIILKQKKNHFYKFFFTIKKFSFPINFYSRSKKNLFRISIQNSNNSIILINKSKDYHNNYHIYKNDNKIYTKNFKKNQSRIMATKKILDIFLGKNKTLKKYLEFKNGLIIQKKINKFL